MAASASSKMPVVPYNELCSSTLSVGEANRAFSEVHRQESGIFESSSDFSDNCFSDTDIEWHSDEDEVSTAEDSNAALWEEFEQGIFLSPVCAIKQSRCITTNTCPLVEEDIPMIRLPSRNKKVTFKPDKELVTIHRIVAWDYAYRSCRRGPWEQMAQDRVRFAKRIEEVGTILEPCLKKLLSQIPSSH